MSEPSSNPTPSDLRTITGAWIQEASTIREGGGERGVDRQHRLERLTARERLALLLTRGAPIFECGLYAAWNMYIEYGGAPAAGVVTAITTVGGKLCMIVANDATVKAGAFFPMTCKKIIRAQVMAHSEPVCR